jgi:hypothetical protein
VFISVRRVSTSLSSCSMRRSSARTSLTIIEAIAAATNARQAKPVSINATPMTRPAAVDGTKSP